MGSQMQLWELCFKSGKTLVLEVDSAFIDALFLGMAERPDAKRLWTRNVASGVTICTSEIAYVVPVSAIR